MSGLLRKARETVECETPANLVLSLIDTDMLRNRILLVSALLTKTWLMHGQTSETVKAHLLPGNPPILDAHNCYPDRGKWADRIDRALATGYPVGIEQDLAWHVDPAVGTGSVVVSHAAETTGLEPSLKAYFFERVRPLVEAELKKNDRTRWPLIIVHFDFKDNQEPLLRAVWKLLGVFEPWLTTATKTVNPSDISGMDVKPILALTEDSDAQEQVFFREIPIGSK